MSGDDAFRAACARLARATPEFLYSIRDYLDSAQRTHDNRDNCLATEGAVLVDMRLHIKALAHHYANRMKAWRRAMGDNQHIDENPFSDEMYSMMVKILEGADVD